VDSTYIRSCEDGQRHLELGNVETGNGARQVFAAVARTDTAIETLIRRSLAEVGTAADTELTAFTDGCPGLRSILVKAGITKPPGLDWFHIAMRLQHAEKTASTLPVDTPEREHARAVIVAEVDRLHWRIWNGKAKDAKVTIERIRAVMPVFQNEQSGRKKGPSSRRLWTALREIDRYLTSQSAWLVNMPSAIVPVCGSAHESNRNRGAARAAAANGAGWTLLAGMAEYKGANRSWSVPSRVRVQSCRSLSCPTVSGALVPGSKALCRRAFGASDCAAAVILGRPKPTSSTSSPQRPSTSPALTHGSMATFGHKRDSQNSPPWSQMPHEVNVGK
jgi:hypothetical protein